MGSNLRQFVGILTLPATRQGFRDLTSTIEGWLRERGVVSGLLTVFVRHTSASILIQENADPDVLHDLAAFFARLAPEDSRLYAHTSEGSDDMPAHIKSALTQTSIAIPVIEGALALGRWQGIYLFEHRRSAGPREIALHLSGE